MTAMTAIRPLGQWSAMLVLSLALALGLRHAGFPAAFLLGPMIVGILFGSCGATIRLPGVAFQGAQAILGCLVAHAVTGSILASVVRDWPSMVAVVSMTVLTSGLVAWLTVRFGTLPGSVAAWGVSPGAASVMVAMSEDFGADPRLVAFMQYLRVVVVVVSASLVSRILLGDEAATAMVPPPAEPLDRHLLGLAATLAVAGIGGWAGWRLRIPAGVLLVPMIVGAALHASGTVALELPPWLLDGAYIAIGWAVGLRFTPEVVGHALRAMPQMLLATLALILLCGLSAWALIHLLDTDPLTAYLATSPSGLDSVTIIAVGSNADVPFVLALQTLRLFVVILTGPAVAKLIVRLA